MTTDKRKHDPRLFVIIAVTICIYAGGGLLFNYLLPHIAFGPGSQDWTYYDLPNGYEIWRVNSQHICLCKNGGEAVLDSYILEFCSNESYIGLKRLEIDGSIPANDVDINGMDKSKADYYIVDTMDSAVMGPYTAEQYSEQLDRLNAGEMSDWIKTFPAPAGAVFGG